MALETAGRGTLIILAVLCLDLQGDAQPLELNFEVGAVFSCGAFSCFSSVLLMESHFSRKHQALHSFMQDKKERVRFVVEFFIEYNLFSLIKHDQINHFTALETALDYLVQVTLALPNLEYLQTVLNTLSFPIMFNEVTEINSINTTTGTSSMLHSSHTLWCIFRTPVNRHSFKPSVYTDCIWQ